MAVSCICSCVSSEPPNEEERLTLRDALVLVGVVETDAEKAKDFRFVVVVFFLGHPSTPFGNNGALRQVQL